MKENRRLLSALAIGILVTIASASLSQAQPQQPPNSNEPQHDAGGGDPIRQLNLTPEQREQIRSIRQQTNVERAEINQRVGASNRALEAALDSDNPDEAAVEQRMKDLAAAQADAMRMRITTEVKIRRVLTIEQRTLLRTLRQEARERQRERLDLRDQRQQQRREARPNVLRNQRNGVAPLFPGRDGQRRQRP
ncbi:MAG TPA: Spy/CpxP family protein refolding chaperone [Pyrinomonadaceae bacterium]|nr:Spy/CpxP family protein refolding chaperone [Pyrinomonadaceae bacterium]